MKGAVIHGRGDVRFEERTTPTIVQPTDAILRLSATCICGSDLWAYRGISPLNEPTPFGHEYCGIVEDAGRGGHLRQTRPVRHRFVLRETGSTHFTVGNAGSTHFMVGITALALAARWRIP